MSGDSCAPFRRRWHAIAADGVVHGAVEDDYHHMEVSVRHDGRVVTDLSARMIRQPWTRCPDAIGRLPQVVGLPLSTRAWILPPDFAAKQHCTHLLDTTLLAIAQAARGGERRYEYRVPDRIEGRTEPTAIRDGREILALRLDGDAVLAPPPFAGRNMRNLVGWAEATLDDDMLEAILLMRRVLLVSRGRGAIPVPRPPIEQAMRTMAGACYTLQPANAPGALPTAMTRPLSDRPQDFHLPA